MPFWVCGGRTLDSWPTRPTIGVATPQACAVPLLRGRSRAVLLGGRRQLVRALDSLSNVVLRSLGHVPGQSQQVDRHALEEVKLIVSGIRRRGWLGERQEEMIHSVFDLHRVLVREIMVPRPSVVCWPMQQNLNALLEQVVEDQHSRIPIYEGLPEHIIGILY